MKVPLPQGVCDKHSTRTSMDAEISSSKPSRRHVVGEVCDIGTTKSPPKDRCLSLITLAWSLILSSQQDSKDVDFDLSMAEVALTPHRLSLSLDQNKPCLDYMKELTTNIPALPVTALGPIDVAAWRGQPAEHWATRTVVAISTTHVNYSELATKGYSLIINCFLDLNQQEIHLSADFDEHVLSRDFVRLLLGDLEHTIWQLSNIQSPRVLLSDIEIIGSSTRRAMVYLNRPNQPKLDCLTHDLIAAHASSHPDSPAVHAWDGIYSYSELDKLSSGLAEHLLRLGIEPESVVPILFEKSKLSIVTMLGVMKAGGAILPLDPGLPLERLRGLVGDVNAPLAISSAKNQGQLAPVVKELVIDDRSLARLLNGTGDSSLIPRSKLVVPDNTLYIMFTSGSTGKPKGVVVSHAAFCSSSAGFRASTHLSSPQRRTLHYASPGFDASILETLVTLTVGGCICIPSDTDRLDDLAKCIRDLDVNWALLTPSVARLLCPSDVPRLQVLCLGGEALSKDLVETWADKVILVNAYGPTEGSIIAVVSEPLSPGIKNIPLGKARNCAVWIVAPDGSKVQPFNTIGEIIIEGPGVAGGYLGDEKKTAAVFGDDAGFLKPITGSSSRYYRTGDLGRMSPDGTIEYFGRKDSQVKINGQRIELGEIEHHFKECLGDSSAPKAYDVVVEPLTAPNGNKTVLAAFVGPAIESSSARRIAQNIVLESDSPLGKDILAAARSVGAKLAQKLPVHMMPKIMLPCRVIPRTSSGKSDRKRLRAEGNALLLRDILSVQQETECSSSDSDQMRESDRPLCETTDEYQSVALTPSTDCDQFIVEQISKQQDSSSLAVPDEDSESDGNFLRRVWAEVLTISETLVSSDADFFKLGGDSIGFIKIVAAYRRAGIPITVAAISKYPTFKRMLQVCQARKSVSDSNPVGNSTKFSLIEPDTADDLCREAAEHLQTKAEDIEDLFPCTNMQEELLVANMMHPGSSVGRFVFKLNCNIDVERLKQAWQTVWSNSPTLKTKVVYTASRGPLQAVVRSPLPWHTASSLSNYIAMDENDLMGPGTPLTRLAIINEEDAIYLVWTMHHMLYDGWSIPLICKKVNALYRGDMVEHRGDFRTFVAYSKSLGSDKQMAYWANVLRDVATSTFPVSDSCKTTCLARSSWKDSLDVTGTAEACSALGVTLPTIIQAAWAIMISDFSDTTDVLFGTTVSGRNAPVENIDCIDGPTLATVPIRLTVTSNTRISDFLESVREFFAELIPYEQSGLQAIRAINSDTARACDFQNLLLIQSEPGWESNTGALGEPSHHGEPLALPLLCQVWIRQDCIEFDVAFDDKVTNLEVIQRSITQVKFIMSQLFSLSDRPAAQLSEIAHAPEVKNTSSTGKIASRTDIEPGPTTIHELITAVAKTHGKQLALCSSAVSLTFDELEQLSLNLAAHLVSLSIGRGSIVPLYFEKSVWTVVSMLATLRAGAAFILLDPTQPVEKLRAISSQINATILLTSSSLHGSVGFGASLKQIIVSSSTTAALPDASLSQLPSVSPHDLAYLIFTSGSTGQPKGVMISHSSMAFSAAAYGNALELKSHTRVLQFSSYSFDASINETLVVLILSATVCIASETERMQDLAGFIRRSEVEWAILTPSVARLLSPDDVPSLMTLDLGGEAPDKTLLSRWHRAGVRVFNVYGPAEGSGTVLCQRYRDELDPRTIGLPMGCNAWIVDRDDHDKLVLEGETGELLIEGPILADGYFEDSKKTAESFIFSPRWATAPTRMYKTGDLCFRDATQVLVYVGRKDFQVKLHGQRVELGDIEHNLARCAGVKSCAVLFPDSGPMSKQLIAIIEQDGNVKDFSTTVKTELSTRVSNAMVPTRWIDVAALFPETKSLPLNPSGKLDRRLLLTSVQKLTESRANEIFSTLDSEYATNFSVSDRIFESEQPAFDLAKKVHAIMKSPSEAKHNTDKGPSFDNICLVSAGLDSLNMMSLMFFISQKFSVNLALPTLLQRDMTLRKLAKLISRDEISTHKSIDTEQKSSVVPSIDIAAEIERHDALLRSWQPIKRRKTVLLTGANGYIGTEILRQLLEHPQIRRVIALVRGETPFAAKTRTIAAANRARWWTDLHEDNLEVWQGDLSQDKLGLSAVHWDQLQDGNVDFIVHNGAAVHWTKDFKSLEAANIDSTVDLLSVAMRQPHIRMTYITGGRGSASPEETDDDIARELSSPDAVGYCQTKFVAEALVKRAARRCGDRFSIISPGLVAGTPEKGVANSDDYLWRLAASCIRIGAYNANQVNCWLQVSDVASLASIIVGATLEPKTENETASIVTEATDGMTWGQFWDILKRLGYKLESLPSSHWLPAIRNDIEQQQEEHPLWPLAHMLETHLMEEDPVDIQRQQAVVPLKLKVAIKRSAEFLAAVQFLPSLNNENDEYSEDTGGAFSRSGK